MRCVVRPLDLSMMNLIVAQAARAAGLGKKVSPHWMRHAHASQALDNGTPLHVLQASLRHMIDPGAESASRGNLAMRYLLKHRNTPAT